jgi:hypothetical protein
MSELIALEPSEQAQPKVPFFSRGRRHSRLVIRAIVLPRVPRAMLLGAACIASSLCMGRLAFAQQPALRAAQFGSTRAIRSLYFSRHRRSRFVGTGLSRTMW